MPGTMLWGVCSWRLLYICALGHSIFCSSLSPLLQQQKQHNSSMQAPIMAEQPGQQGPAGDAALGVAATFQMLYSLYYVSMSVL